MNLQLCASCLFLHSWILFTLDYVHSVSIEDILNTHSPVLGFHARDEADVNNLLQHIHSILKFKELQKEKQQTEKQRANMYSLNKRTGSMDTGVMFCVGLCLFYDKNLYYDECLDKCNRY